MCVYVYACMRVCVYFDMWMCMLIGIASSAGNYACTYVYVCMRVCVYA